MTKHYHDYFWKEGIPYGLVPIDDNQTTHEVSYKIVMDPYRKRISIEKYAQRRFVTSIYDSSLLNFRHLNAVEQQGWQKTTLKETDDCVDCIIRNQDDRVLFLETYTFDKNYCKRCEARSPQGILLSIQIMHYKILGDQENEVILYDANGHAVLQKLYEADPVTGEFTNLIREIRDTREVQVGKN